MDLLKYGAGEEDNLQKPKSGTKKKCLEIRLIIANKSSKERN